MIWGFILGFIAAFIVTSVSYCKRAQAGYILVSDGRKVVWIHRDEVERGIWDLNKLRKK